MRSILILCLLYILPASAVHAADSKPYTEGMAAFSQGNWEEAYGKLFIAFLEEPANPTINFQLGRAAFEKRDFENAIMAFERVLVMEPESNRAKLELARCHYELKSFETARQYFLEVLASNPPESVSNNIKNFFAAMEQAERQHFFHGAVSLGYNVDSNVRTAPGLASVDITIPGLGIMGAVDLAPSSGQEERDSIITNFLYLNHTYQFTDSILSWKSSVLDYNSFYDTTKDLDLIYIGLTTGPSWKFGDSVILDLTGSLNHIDLDYAPYLFSYGGSMGLTWTMTPNFQVAASSRLEEKEYQQVENSGKNSTNSKISLAALLSLDQNRFSLSLLKESETANVATETYNRGQWGLAYNRNLPLDFNISVALEYKKSQYKGYYPLFSTRRTDAEKTFSGVLSRSFWKNEEKGLALNFSISHAYTDNDSTIPLYKYRKNLTSTGLAFSF